VEQTQNIQHLQKDTVRTGNEVAHHTAATWSNKRGLVNMWHTTDITSTIQTVC